MPTRRLTWKREILIRAGLAFLICQLLGRECWVSIAQAEPNSGTAHVDLTDYRACGVVALYAGGRLLGADVALSQIRQSADPDHNDVTSFADLQRAKSELSPSRACLTLTICVISAAQRLPICDPIRSQVAGRISPLFWELKRTVVSPRSILQIRWDSGRQNHSGACGLEIRLSCHEMNANPPQY